jgi:hypothetical protein
MRVGKDLCTLWHFFTANWMLSTRRISKVYEGRGNCGLLLLITYSTLN